MQGTEKPDRGLLDALGLCGALVREGSVYRFLAEYRLRLFGDGLFADLFGGRGRPSVPGSVIAVVMVLQALEGCSDREAVERLRCDVRWKAAAGLGIDDEGFDASVLTLWRQGSVRFLAEYRLRLFGDGLFADLFGGRGRPSVPGSVIAVVMVLAGGLLCAPASARSGSSTRCARWLLSAGRCQRGRGGRWTPRCCMTRSRPRTPSR